MPQQDTPQPMDPERLADLREGLDDNRAAERPVPHDLVCELLADRDRLAAERDSAREIAEYWRDLVCDDFGGCSIDARLPWEPAGAADA